MGWYAQVEKEKVLDGFSYNVKVIGRLVIVHHDKIEYGIGVKKKAS